MAVDESKKWNTYLIYLSIYHLISYVLFNWPVVFSIVLQYRKQCFYLIMWLKDPKKITGNHFGKLLRMFILVLQCFLPFRQLHDSARFDIPSRQSCGLYIKRLKEGSCKHRKACCTGMQAFKWVSHIHKTFLLILLLKQFFILFFIW